MEFHLTGGGGREPKLVQEVEKYHIEIVGLTSAHSMVPREGLHPPLL